MELKKTNRQIAPVTIIVAFISNVIFAQSASPTDSIQIGSQIWTKKNLDIGHFKNGDPIPEVRSEKEWMKAAQEKRPAWCYFENDPKNGKKFGRLYNWYAISDPRGLVPEGWHIPNYTEWKTLADFLDPTAPGFKMKAMDGWTKNGNGSNESGFTALAGGYRDYYVENFTPGCYFSPKGNWALWWTSTPISTFDKENETFGLLWQFGMVRWLQTNKGAGVSVRLIKD